MSLINCPECKKEISDLAESCPQCGYKLKLKKDVSKKPRVFQEPPKSRNPFGTRGSSALLRI
jgi:predicted amidophosphoribosyltransferase